MIFAFSGRGRREEHRIPGWALPSSYLGEQTSGPSFMNSDRPGIKRFPREKRMEMFQGTMIDELIQCVERAEQNARQRRQQESLEMEVERLPLNVLNWRHVPEVA